VEDARRLAAIGRGDDVDSSGSGSGSGNGLGNGNARTRAVVHRGMRHPWNRQDGGLFADVIVAWAERGEVLEDRGFESL